MVYGVLPTVLLHVVSYDTISFHTHGAGGNTDNNT